MDLPVVKSQECVVSSTSDAVGTQQEEDLFIKNNVTDSQHGLINNSNTKAGAVKLRKWLNKCLQVEMTDGRILIGIFLCTDRDANVILGTCAEYLPSDKTPNAITEEPRMLGLVMVPGKHIVKVSIDLNETPAISNTIMHHESEII